MPKFQAINVSPFATNVLDLVGKPGLKTKAGQPVEVSRSGMDFVVKVGGTEVARTSDNLAASYALNRYEVGILE